MLISVIVPTYNRNDLLSRCLDRLNPAFQTIDPSEYKVLVTDDSKDYKAKGLLEEKYPWAEWVAGPQKGPAANRNNGAKESNGEWLVFIDDDCLPERDLLEKYKKAINEYPESLAFEGAILPDDYQLLKKDMSDCPVNTEGGCFWSANICINKLLFEKVHGFDEEYLIAAQEDQQMKIDIEAETRKKIVFLKQCIVIHPVRFLKVMSQIKKIPIASKNFVIYVNKNNGILPYNSTLDFGLKQFGFHLRRTILLAKTGKVKSLIVSIIWLLYGVPLNIINLRKPNKV